MPTPHQPTNHTELIARALILHNAHVLMCRSVAKEYLYLPGGHIEFAEPASEALKRELLEECNQRITVGPLLLTTEGAFFDGRTDHHEINLVFQAELFHVEQLDGTLPRVESAEEHIEFVWVDLAAVTDLDIRPTEIKAWLASGGRIAGSVDRLMAEAETGGDAGADTGAGAGGGAGVGVGSGTVVGAGHLVNFEVGVRRGG